MAGASGWLPLALPYVRRGEGCALARNTACQTPAQSPSLKRLGLVRRSGALRKRGRKCRWRGIISREGMVSFLASPDAVPSLSPDGPSRMRRGGAHRTLANSPARPAPATWRAPTARFCTFPMALSRVRRRGFRCVLKVRQIWRSQRRKGEKARRKMIPAQSPQRPQSDLGAAKPLTLILSRQTTGNYFVCGNSHFSAVSADSAREFLCAFAPLRASE